MRVTHLLWGLSTGGIENMLVDIVNAQIENNEISLVVVNDMIDPTIAGRLDHRVKVYLCNRKRGSKNPLFFLKFNYFIAKSNPDIVHVHYDGLARFVFWRWPIVRTFHSTLNERGEANYFRALYAISNAVRDYWNEVGVETTVIENGLNCSLVNCSRNGLFKDDCLHFVQVSRLYIRQKGQDLILKALSKIKHEGLCEKKLIMHFVGEGPDKDLLMDMAKDFDIEECVRFEGNMPRSWIFENLCNFDLFIQPSRHEGFGLTVAEAMLAKVPILCSNIEGPVEIITPKGGDSSKLMGRTFELDDSDDLAKQIVSYVVQGRDETLVEAGRQHIIKNYNIKKTANEYLTEYQKALS